MHSPKSYQEEKLVELMLYIGAKCARDEHYGVLKLNKILFYSDFRAYRTLGKPITGAEYRKYPHGPAPCMMKALRQRLIDSGAAIEYQNPLPFLDGNGRQMREKQLLPKRAPKLETFTPMEMSLIDSVIEWLRPFTGTELSVMSHAHPGWRFAQMEDAIPYTAELLEGPTVELSKVDAARALRVAEEYRRGEIEIPSN